jgi:hypothetical protein
MEPPPAASSLVTSRRPGTYFNVVTCKTESRRDQGNRVHGMNVHSSRVYADLEEESKHDFTLAIDSSIPRDLQMHHRQKQIASYIYLGNGCMRR